MTKKFTLSIFAAAAAIGLFSCDNGAMRLSRDIEGSWSGAPEKLVQSGSSEATVIETYDFLGNDSINGGNIIINSILSVTGQITGSEAIVQPFSLTASGSATISGTWRAIDDDEISIALDPRTLQVNVDPDAIVLSSNILSGTEAPSVDSIAPGIAAQIRSQMSQALEMRYLTIKHLDDVKIKDNILKYEIADIDYLLQRQGIPVK